MKAIDLGLPSGLLWADKNIGATTEEDAGLYFQWGDIQGYTAEQIRKHEKLFSGLEKDYKFGYSTNYSKYNNVDRLIVLVPIDDAATQIMGSDWRMPTRDDFIELVENTDIFFIPSDGNEEIRTGIEVGKRITFYTFPRQDTMRGMKFYNKTDHSKYIFVPASGYARNGNIFGEAEIGYLWSSTIFINGLYNAWNLYFHSPEGYAALDFVNRCGGVPIRGIKSK